MVAAEHNGALREGGAASQGAGDVGRVGPLPLGDAGVQPRRLRGQRLGRGR
ncbi:hypothetical protein MF672_050915 (plasmid) [Actinomadura sp. ATCC 31491]|uniref:Uncharacterized protein n=1 Tax=Actinomadura luzonensis TaxID=2805427 RepID=A0ABT0GBX3_9ACTN|nr:hypothetical protein [Actinomadura luzonensis]MCK2222066.1 hypothetical protein [Actinomadura luzonensis]